MESINFNKLFHGVYKNRRVLVTGHSGFKGSWLCLWLKQMGAIVYGYSLVPNTKPSHEEILDYDFEKTYADIRDKESFEKAVLSFSPEIIFHLAAQPLVRYSYEEPVETFETNIMGTVNLFEIIKKCKSIKAVINVTTDKCYKNIEKKDKKYEEGDSLGGYDPYSASKACSEIITSSYRDSFFNLDDYEKKHNVLIASCRAGNVIGGGDWSEDRLIPDIIESVNKNEKLYIRSPFSIRPWQHVLEPLSGYLLLGEKLLNGKKEFASSWNFGPREDEILDVESIVKKAHISWNKIEYKISSNPKEFHEANLLILDCTKAKEKLAWEAIWDIEKTIEKTIIWYKDFYKKGKVNTDDDLISFLYDAKRKKVDWIND